MKQSNLARKRLPVRVGVFHSARCTLRAFSLFSCSRTKARAMGQGGGRTLYTLSRGSSPTPSLQLPSPPGVASQRKMSTYRLLRALCFYQQPNVSWLVLRGVHNRLYRRHVCQADRCAWVWTGAR